MAPHKATQYQLGSCAKVLATFDNTALTKCHSSTCHRALTPTSIPKISFLKPNTTYIIIKAAAMFQTNHNREITESAAQGFIQSDKHTRQLSRYPLCSPAGACSDSMQPHSHSHSHYNCLAHQDPLPHRLCVRRVSKCDHTYTPLLTHDAPLHCCPQ